LSCFTATNSSSSQPIVVAPPRLAASANPVFSKACFAPDLTCFKLTLLPSPTRTSFTPYSLNIKHNASNTLGSVNTDPPVFGYGTSTRFGFINTFASWDIIDSIPPKLSKVFNSISFTTNKSFSL